MGDGSQVNCLISLVGVKEVIPFPLFVIMLVLNLELFTLHDTDFSFIALVLVIEGLP